MDLGQSLAAVALVLALLGGLLWALRRAGAARFGWPAAGAGRGRHLELIETRALGPGASLHLVRAAGQVLVVATHAGGCTLIQARPAAEVERESRP